MRKRAVSDKVKCDGRTEIRMPKEARSLKSEGQTGARAVLRFGLSDFVTRKLEKNSEQRCDGAPFIVLAGQ
jgi:hypothetical protein